MKLLRRLKAHCDERGVALPFVALMMTVLLGMTALAVDLGWLYLNGSRVQRGADAAALAAVVHLPADIAQVNAQTVNGANANGWDVGSLNGNPISGGGPDVMAWQPLSDNRLEVTLEAAVPTFFMKVFGMDEVTISRRATAEYIKPVPMGSPSACFGIGGYAASLTGDESLSSQGLGHCAAWTMNFWAAINGPRTAKEHGDPYAVACITANSSGCTSSANDDYRPSGYFYGLEVPSGKSSITIKLFDAGFYTRSTPQTETGDFRSLTNSYTGAGPTTQYRLYAPDATPLDPTDNSTLLCSASYAAESSSPNTRNLWVNLCTLNNPTPGIHVLNVRTTGTGGGTNQYSIGVTASPNTAPHVRTYAINDMSIFTNAPSGVATVYLAEVDAVHAGKTLQLNFYDPGENFSGDAWVTVRQPNNAIPNCNWNSVHDNGTPGPNGSGACTIQSTIAGTPRFNAHWLNATITIPSGYSCGTDCYWRMNLDMGTSQDRTTWAARVIGNPVRLVPNEP
jgi:hypothetical protein